MKVMVFAHHHAELMSGGAERAAYSLVQQINISTEHEAVLVANTTYDKLGHDGNFASFRGRDNEILWAAPVVDHFTFLSNDQNRLRRDLIELINYVQPDIIHFHHYVNFGIDAFNIIKEHFSIPIMLTLHEYLMICHNDGQMVKNPSMKLCKESSAAECASCFPNISSGRFFLREQLIKHNLSYVDHIFSPSVFLAERYKQWGVEGDKISVIENLLPADLVNQAEILEEPLSKDFSDGKQKLRLGYFGQINPYKGAPLLLDAIESLPTKYRKRVELIIFGANLEHQTEDFRHKLGSQIDRLGRSCTMYGSYRNEDVISLMRSVDWAVIPSTWWENSPLVIQEAALAKVPILGSNIGGMKEKIIHYKTGAHFLSGSAVDISSKIIKILDAELSFNYSQHTNDSGILLEKHLTKYRSFL